MNKINQWSPGFLHRPTCSCPSSRGIDKFLETCCSTRTPDVSCIWQQKDSVLKNPKNIWAVLEVAPDWHFFVEIIKFRIMTFKLQRAFHGQVLNSQLPVALRRETPAQNLITNNKLRDQVLSSNAVGRACKYTYVYSSQNLDKTRDSQENQERSSAARKLISKGA